MMSKNATKIKNIETCKKRRAVQNIFLKKIQGTYQEPISF